MRAGLQPVFHLTFLKRLPHTIKGFLRRVPAWHLTHRCRSLRTQPWLTAVLGGGLASAVACGPHCLATADRQLWPRPHGQRGTGGPHAPWACPPQKLPLWGLLKLRLGGARVHGPVPGSKAMTWGPRCHVPVVPAAWQQGAEGGTVEGEARPPRWEPEAILFFSSHFHQISRFVPEWLLSPFLVSGHIGLLKLSLA